ncbi:MAG TPA: hypothetical protein VMT16_05255 [Thermoanaerobaculia bacterium]|nr:hypothetical protein [Thermoanaerobaculia bacterium]
MRFLLLALPLLLLLLAGGAFALEVAGWAGEDLALARLGLERDRGVGPWRLAEWGLEAVGLTALFLLIEGRGSRWVDGLLAGGVAWVFRGPLLLLTLARLTWLPGQPWLAQVLGWLPLYLAGGLLLAFLAGSLKLER